MAKPTNPKAYLSPLLSILFLAPFFAGLIYYAGHLHYSLPEPLSEPFNRQTGKPQFSEKVALAHMQNLQNCGYRIVGTYEHERGLDYLLNEVQKLLEMCKEGEKERKFMCGADLQEGSGNHRFNILDHDVLKTYTALHNVVLMLIPIDRTPDSPTLLLNSHLDSQLPGPGASDDGVGVAIMLETARILIQRGTPLPGNNSILFLFNNAEESLQDGSHLFSTQWNEEERRRIKAMINLESAGVTGGEMLFQATSSNLVKAYAKVPHPHGTVLAADVFSSGIIGSDTDFGQFESYLDLKGLDMAVVGHSYYYHTDRDVVANIEPGSTQHFGENILALVDHLLGPDGGLDKMTLGKEPTEKGLVYWSLFDRVFVYYSQGWAQTQNFFLGAFYFWSLLLSVNSRNWKAHVVATITPFAGLIAALISANVVAGIMHFGGRGMSWFTNEASPLVLYGPPAMLGQFLANWMFSKVLSPIQFPYLESAGFNAVIGLNFTFMTLGTYFGIRGSYLFGVIGSWGVITIIFNTIFTRLFGGRGHTNILTYAFAQAMPVILGVEACTTVLDIFVPLTGRMSEKAPVEFIIATISSVLVSLFTPVAAPFFHRFGRKFHSKALLGMMLATGVVMAVFWTKDPFDETHPRRIFFEHEFNITSGEYAFHTAAMDPAPGTAKLVNEIQELIGVPEMPAKFAPMHAFNPSWDGLYPVGEFFTTYVFGLPTPEGFTDAHSTFSINAIQDSFDVEADERSITLQVNHSQLIWPVISFEALILEWPFNSPPPTTKERHHLKSASSYGVDSYEVSFKVKGNEPIMFDFVGMEEKGMYPNTALVRGAGMAATETFTKVDNFLKVDKKNKYATLMMQTLTGTVWL